MRKEYSKYIIVNENLLTLLQNSRMESLYGQSKHQYLIQYLVDTPCKLLF